MLFYEKGKRNASIPFKGKHKIASGGVFAVNLPIFYQYRKLLNDIKYFHCEFQKKTIHCNSWAKGLAMCMQSESKTMILYLLAVSDSTLW